MQPTLPERRPDNNDVRTGRTGEAITSPLVVPPSVSRAPFRYPTLSNRARPFPSQSRPPRTHPSTKANLRDIPTEEDADDLAAIPSRKPRRPARESEEPAEPYVEDVQEEDDEEAPRRLSSSPMPVDPLAASLRQFMFDLNARRRGGVSDKTERAELDRASRGSAEEFEVFYAGQPAPGVRVPPLPKEAASERRTVTIVNEEEREPIHVMDVFWGAFRDGKVPYNITLPAQRPPPQRAGEGDLSMADAEGVWKVVSGAMAAAPQRSVLVVGGWRIGMVAARADPSRTVVVLDERAPPTGGSGSSAITWSPNSVVASPTGPQLLAALDALYASPLVVFGAVIIDDMSQLMQDLLPQELEAVVARLLTLGREVFVMEWEARWEGGTHAYFEHWGKAQALLDRAAKLANVRIDFGLKTEVYPRPNLIRGIVREAAREVPAERCLAAIGASGLQLPQSTLGGEPVAWEEQPCVFFLRTPVVNVTTNGTTRTLPITDDCSAKDCVFALALGTELFAVPRRVMGGVPLHVLLQTGLAPEHRLSLFRHFLELPSHLVPEPDPTRSSSSSSSSSPLSPPDLSEGATESDTPPALLPANTDGMGYPEGTLFVRGSAIVLLRPLERMAVPVRPSPSPAAAGRAGGAAGRQAGGSASGRKQTTQFLKEDVVPPKRAARRQQPAEDEADEYDAPPRARRRVVRRPAEDTEEDVMEKEDQHAQRQKPRRTQRSESAADARASAAERALRESDSPAGAQESLRGGTDADAKVSARKPASSDISSRDIANGEPPPAAVKPPGAETDGGTAERSREPTADAAKADDVLEPAGNPAGGAKRSTAAEDADAEGGEGSPANGAAGADAGSGSADEAPGFRGMRGAPRRRLTEADPAGAEGSAPSDDAAGAAGAGKALGGKQADAAADTADTIEGKKADAAMGDEVATEKPAGADPARAPDDATLKPAAGAAFRAPRPDAGNAAGEGSKAPGARRLMAWNGPAARERQARSDDIFSRQWDALRSQISGRDTPFTVLTYGSSVTMLGLKLARTNPSASVLNIIPPFEQHIIDQQRRLSGQLSLTTMQVIPARLTAELVSALYASPDILEYQILGLEVFAPLLTLGAAYPNYLGRVLALARTTFLEVPLPEQLRTGAALFSENSGAGASAVFPGLVRAALSLAGVDDAELTMLPDAGSDTAGRMLIRIDLVTARRPVQVSCERSAAEGALILSNTEARVEVAGKTHALARAGSGLSLSFYLALRPSPSVLARLFRSYLRLPLREDMCPVHLSLRPDRSLAYDPVGIRASLGVSPADETELLARALVGELALWPHPFSFLEYGSGEGNVSLAVARAYPEASIFSLQDGPAGKVHHNKIKAGKVANNIVGYRAPLPNLVHLVYDCPEFLRYQFLGRDHFLRLVLSQDQDVFGHMLGEMASTGMTTYLQLPSAAAVSIALTTLFPVEGERPEGWHLRSSHPLPLFIYAEERMVGEIARANTKFTQVSATVLNVNGDGTPPGRKAGVGPIRAIGRDRAQRKITEDGEKDEAEERMVARLKGGSAPTWTGGQLGDVHLPWSLLRLDVRNMTVQVNHHFDYAKDGHERQYVLRCVTNETHWAVSLTRTVDGFTIPWETIRSMTLIALLRLELPADTSASFYDKFLKLPFYEDMAPWNIVFEGGQLNYIDYDTRDSSFDKVVPAAYQVMSMLMNYERTVKDFGRCGRKGENGAYNFPYISACVGNENKGPCTSSEEPVPCGDGRCHSTYVSCLIALNDMEKARQARIDGGLTATREARQVEVFQKGSWTFSAQGVVEAKKPKR